MATKAVKPLKPPKPGTAKAFAAEVADQGRAATSRVARLSAPLRGGLVAVIGEGTSGAERRQLWAVADRYFELLERIEQFRDPHTVAAFTQVDDILAKHLATRNTPDADILRRDLAHARAVFLQDPATRKAEFDQALGLLDLAARVPKPNAEMVAIHDALLDRLRAVRALAPGTATVRQQRVRSALRRIRKVFGADRFDAWLPALRYAQENAEGIARRARGVATAEKALAQATQHGDATAIEAAEQALRKAREALQGDRSKLQGTLAELYVTRWKDWKIQMEAFVDLGRTEITRLDGVWEVVPVSGDLLLDGKQTWDAAVLLLRKDTGEVQLLMAAQFKAEKTDSALKQVLLDMERETRAGKYTRAPVVSWYDEAGDLQKASLAPPSTRAKATRYVGTAAGGKFSAAQSARLEAAKVEVNQFWLDITRDELEALSDEILAAVAAMTP